MIAQEANFEFKNSNCIGCEVNTVVWNYHPKWSCQMSRKDLKSWRKNRHSSLIMKVRRWRSNAVGAAVRIIEILYFRQPLVNIFIGYNGQNGNSRGIELISHMSNSIDSKLTNEHYIFLNDVRIDMRENFVQLDTGHVLNSRKTPNEVLSGQYWDQIRKVQRSRVPINAGRERVYSIAKQEFFYHFLLEELPEILSINDTQLVEKFVSLPNQPRYVEELLNLCGIKLEYVSEIVQGFANLIYATYSRANTPWAINQLQSLIQQDVVEFSGPRKLLLLRDGETRTDLAFEDSLRDFLIPNGFECINLNLLSNLEQINLFNNATDIVAIHGGALSNIVFTRKETRIFEIFSHNYRTYFFREIAYARGNRYIGAESSEAIKLLETWISSN